MKIVYTGKRQYDREYLSTYFLGEISHEDYKKYYNTHYPYINYYDDRNIGRLHYSIVKSFLKEERRLLYDWLQECKISFGGYIDMDIGGADFFLLLYPDTPEELAFRLCYNIRVRIE
jgi:hypothetical protein